MNTLKHIYGELNAHSANHISVFENQRLITMADTKKDETRE